MHMSLSASLSCFLAVIHYVRETIPPPDNAVNDGIYIHTLAYATAASHICHALCACVCARACVCVSVHVCEVALQWDHH